jgi:hypothetical protein
LSELRCSHFADPEQINLRFGKLARKLSNGSLADITGNDARQLAATGDDLLAWAKASLPLKDTLLEADARLVEGAFERRLEKSAPPPPKLRNRRQ